jgi:TnpA family transposase
MTDARPRILTDEQRLWLTTIPPDLSQKELVRYYTLSPDDIAFIQRHYKDENRLGIAVQLCGLRYPGRRLVDLLPIPEPVLGYIAEQMDIAPEAFTDYGQREATIYEHRNDIRQAYGYRNYDARDQLPLTRHLLPLAMESDEPVPLVQTALDYMRQQRIIAPGITTTESLVWRAQRIARRRVYQRLTKMLSPMQRLQLDGLVDAEDSEFSTSVFGWLRVPVGKPSPDSIYHLLARLAYIDDLKLPPHPESVHLNRIRQLAQQARRYKAQQVNKFEPLKSHAYLMAYLYEMTAELTDQLLDTFDRLFTDLLRRGRNAQKHYLYRNVALLNRAINTFTLMAEAFLQARQNKEDPVAAILTIVDEPTLQATVKVAKSHMRPASMDYRDLLENRYRYRRRKSLLEMYQATSFVPVAESHAALEALDYIVLLMEMYDERVVAAEQIIQGQRFIAPLQHLKHTRWKRHALKKNGAINPNYYEMGAWQRLREGVRAGDIAVPRSRRYRAFEDDLLSPAEWEGLKQKNETRLAVGDDPDTYLTETQETIADLLVQLPALLAKEDYLTVNEEGHLRLTPQEKTTPEAVDSWRNTCHNAMPEVQLADIIIEVDRWTNCLEAFRSLGSDLPAEGATKRLLIAAIMATGMNLELTQMARATDFSYEQLRQVADNFIREDTIRPALAILDNFVLHHPFSRHWGQGVASSSDGLRMTVPVSAPNARYNERYFHFQRGITVVTHAADIWMPFETTIADTSEPLHVIDALCHHETDFDIQEHYTDTGGYSYHVFALCRLLGFRFAPRIRSITDQYLFSVSPFTPPEAVGHLWKGVVNKELVRRNWDAQRRLAASIRHGRVSASLSMRKLAAYPRQNELAEAFNEVGKLERTVFVLNYWLDPALQQRVRRGLNKGESVYRLARAVAIGQDGEMREQELYDQMNRASCLMLLVGMIAAWNTVYLDRIVVSLQEQGAPVPTEYLQHISPLSWRHINFLGRYEFDLDQPYSLDNLRSLRPVAR